jgi:peptide/nickel transport system permease protein
LRYLFKVFITLFAISSLLFCLFYFIPNEEEKQSVSLEQRRNSNFQIAERNWFGNEFFEGYVEYISDLSIVNLAMADEIPHEWNVLLNIPFGSMALLFKTPHLGWSSYVHASVSSMILAGLTETILLVLSSLLLALIIGIPAGIIAARHKDKTIDKLIQSLNALGLAVPSFVIAMFLAWLIGFVLHDYIGLPVTGSLFEYDIYAGKEKLMLSHLVLPSIALAIRPISVTGQLMRNSMVEVLDQHYIRTARAKGLPELKVLIKHALRNALYPVFGAFTGWISALIAGAMFVEFVFGYKGLGSALLGAIEHQDLPVMMGITLLIATVYVIVDEGLKFFVLNFDRAGRNS